MDKILFGETKERMELKAGNFISNSMSVLLAGNFVLHSDIPIISINIFLGQLIIFFDQLRLAEIRIRLFVELLQVVSIEVPL